jgi:uncharacterized membrane protein YcaP (DUF421 family)
MTIPEVGSGLPEVILRVAIIYLFLVVVLRISGKREVGQMSILELIVVLLISDAVQNSMVGDNTTVWAGPVAVLTLLGLDYALAWLTRRSKKVRQAIEGEPRLLVRDGRLLRKALREEKLSVDEVETAVRAHGLARIDDVQEAVLETDGSISIIPKPEASKSQVGTDPNAEAQKGSSG